MLSNEIRALLRAVGSGAYRDGSSLSSGTTYHEIPCAGFAGVPKHKDTARGEFDFITEHVGGWGCKSVLDVGCNVGHFTIRAAKGGADNVLAVEADERNAALAGALARQAGVSDIVDVRSESFSAGLVQGKSFDVAIMMNVHMWLEKNLGRDGCVEAMRVLSGSCGRLYFQTAHAESAGMHLVEHLKDEAGIKSYLEECWFADVECIRPTREHGGLRLMFSAGGAQ